jgi:hypothetical protein
MEQLSDFLRSIRTRAGGWRPQDGFKNYQMFSMGGTGRRGCGRLGKKRFAGSDVGMLRQGPEKGAKWR